MASLTIDTRERSITQYADILAAIPYKIDQITIGDYVVSAGNRILAVIERKSLSDFAASMADGRIDNRQKMYELRERTGCRVLFIVEGPEFPKPETTIGKFKTPYKAIESCIFHMMIRDQVSVIRTANELDTAKMLVRFVASMNTLLAKIGGAELDQPAAEAKDCDVDAEINRKIVKPDDEIVGAMWATIPRISAERAPFYMRKWTLAALVCGKITLDEIKATKTAAGKSLGPKLWQTLFGLPAADDVHLRLLAAIPGLSKPTAAELLKGRTLAALLTMTAEEIAVIPVGKSQRALGPKKSQSIIHYFNYQPA